MPRMIRCSRPSHVARYSSLRDRPACSAVPCLTAAIAATSVATKRLHVGVADGESSQFECLQDHTQVPLDRVQKGLPTSAEATTRLRKAGLIVGRRPHLTSAPSPGGELT